MKTNLFNKAAEEAIIAYLVANNETAIDEIMTSLKAEDFYIPEHRFIFIAALGLWRNRQTVDIVNIYENIKNVKTITFETQDVLTYLASFSGKEIFGADLNGAITILKENSMYRAAIALVTDFTATVNETPNRTLDTLINKLTALGSNPENKGLTLADGLAGALSYLEGKNTRGEIKTGFARFDNNVQLMRKEVSVIAARPAAGKSAFAAQVAANMALKGGNKVALFSLEMSAELIAMRLLAEASDQDMRELMRKNYNVDSTFNAYGTLATENMHIYDTVFTIEEITKHCRMLKKKHNIDCVIIDYLQLITTQTKVQNTNDRVSLISRTLKLIASELDIAIIVLSQMSRDIEKREDKMPRMSDVRDSGAVEQDAYVLIFLTENKEKSTEYWSNPEIYKFITAYVAKNRNGATGYLNFRFNAPKMRFQECDKDGKIL